MRRKVLLFVMMAMLVLSGCSSGGGRLDKAEVLEKVKQANDPAAFDGSYESVFADVKKNGRQHFSIYVDSISSEYDTYLDDASLEAMEVSERDYRYGFDSNGIFYNNINLSGEYDRYHDVYSYDWDILDLKTVERSDSNIIMTFTVNDENKAEYLKEYALNADGISRIDVTMIVDGEKYVLLYRSDVATDSEKNSTTLVEYEYKYNEENPQAEKRTLLDDHNKKADRYRIITVYIDPDTTIEQLATYKSPVGDKCQLLMEEGYEIDNERSLLLDVNNSYNLTYYLVNDKNKDLIISKEEEKEAEKKEDRVLTDKDFVVLTDIVPDVILEMRYHSTYNFVGERIDGYDEPIAIVTYKTALALKEVADELAQQGYRLKIFDAYRPSTAEEHFVRWAKDTDDTKMKEYFYPDVNKEDLFKLGYIAEKSGHGRGSTLDLTIFDEKTGRELDMGTPFDYFSEKSHPDYRGISDEQFNNRMLLRDVMVKHGFKPYYGEWWHFTLENEPYTDTYFSFPVSRDSVE